MSNQTLIAIDTEWGYRSSRIGCESDLVPIMLCAVIFPSGPEHVFWPGRDDERLAAFLAEHRDALFIAHSAMAEMKYLFRLRMPMPENWFDTLIAERWLTNWPERIHASLAAALERRNLGHLVWAEKSDFRDRLLTLDFQFKDTEFMDEVARYCIQDCRASAALYREQLCDPIHRVKLERLMTWYPHYLLALSRMELRGVPIDMARYELMFGQWPKVKEALADEVNAIASVMKPTGLNRINFAKWCTNNGVPLPTQYDKFKRTRHFSIANDALKEIEHHNPFIAQVRQTQKTLMAIRKNKLVMDSATGKHHFSVLPFGTLTGRNAPKGFVFNMPKWMRFLVVPESPEHTLVYVDYSAQEIGIAAALSHDPGMQAMYQAEDPHMAFAELAGAVPKGAKKDDFPAVRKKYKTVNLGVLYGLTPDGSSRKLGISVREAQALHEEHQRLFPAFRSWIERVVVSAFYRRSIRTRLGWRSLVPQDSNPRTWANWPMQAAGADIMRLTIMYMDKMGIALLAPVHDGFLLSCHRNDLPNLQRAVDSACGAAVEHVLPDFKLRWTTTIYEERFEDSDGLPLWETVQRLLRNFTV